jgi:hypothetical protein
MRRQKYPRASQVTKLVTVDLRSQRAAVPQLILALNGGAV